MNRYPGRSDGVAKRDCIQQRPKIWERWMPEGELPWGVVRKWIGRKLWSWPKTKVPQSCYPKMTNSIAATQKRVWARLSLKNGLKPKMDAADRTTRSPRYLWVPGIGSHAVIGLIQFWIPLKFTWMQQKKPLSIKKAAQPLPWFLTTIWLPKHSIIWMINERGNR